MKSDLNQPRLDDVFTVVAVIITGTKVFRTGTYYGESTTLGTAASVDGATATPVPPEIHSR